MVLTREEARKQVDAALAQFPEDIQIQYMEEFVKMLLEKNHTLQLEPKVVSNPCGRPQKSTKRLPSKFEVTEKLVRKRDREAKRVRFI